MAILAVAQPTYKPAMRIISSITQGIFTTITTSFDHLYVDGLIVRLIIPVGYGMWQANELCGPIVVTGATTFTMAIDSTLFDAFVAPVTFPYSYQYAQVVPVGELNSLLTSATQNVLPYS